MGGFPPIFFYVMRKADECAGLPFFMAVLPGKDNDGERQDFGQGGGEPDAGGAEPEGEEKEARDDEHETAQEGEERGAQGLFHALQIADEYNVERGEEHAGAVVGEALHAQGEGLGIGAEEDARDDRRAEDEDTRRQEAGAHAPAHHKAARGDQALTVAGAEGETHDGLPGLHDGIRHHEDERQAVARHAVGRHARFAQVVDEDEVAHYHGAAYRHFAEHGGATHAHLVAQIAEGEEEGLE